MATPAPTVADVMQRSFSRANIVEALELFGVRANARTTATTLKVQLVQLIQDQAPCSVVCDGISARTRSCSSELNWQPSVRRFVRDYWN
jgi:hypothetical protein